MAHDGIYVIYMNLVITYVDVSDAKGLHPFLQVDDPTPRGESGGWVMPIQSRWWCAVRLADGVKVCRCIPWVCVHSIWCVSMPI